jgi:hypothetical protein
MPLFGPVGWELLGYTKLGSSNNAITVSNIPNRMHLFAVLSSTGQSAGQAAGIQFNGDTASDYTGGTSIGSSIGNNTGARTIWYYIFNEATAQKLVSLIGTNTSGGQEDNRGAWGNTSATINQVTVIVVGGSATWNTGTELWVYGLNG